MLQSFTEDLTKRPTSYDLQAPVATVRRLHIKRVDIDVSYPNTLVSNILNSTLGKARLLMN